MGIIRNKLSSLLDRHLGASLVLESPDRSISVVYAGVFWPSKIIRVDGTSESKKEPSGSPGLPVDILLFGLF